MTPQDIQTIHALLTNRVACQNAREGVAIAQLAAKLVEHFAKEHASAAAAATSSKPEDQR